MHWGNRDKKGRFVKYKKPSTEVEKIREAFIAGFNDQGGIERRPGVKADKYLKLKGYIS